MMTTCAEKRVGEKGFSLIEALAALALTGLVLSALATITAQWLPNWNRGFDRIQQSELVGISMRRIAADLAAAEYVPPNRDQDKPLFDGSALSVTFVRTALGPNVGVGLDVVRIGETTDRGQSRHGALARGIRATPARPPTVGTDQCFRPGGIAAAAVPSVVRLCRS